MKCLSCGTELENGEIFCPGCGEEVQIISDVNTLEEDVLLHLMKEDEYSAYEGEEEDEPFLSGKTKRFFYFILADAIAVCVVSLFVLFYFH